MRIHKSTFLAMAAAPFVAINSANADVILCPDSTNDAVLVFDAENGDMLGQFDTSAFTSTPIECVDGPDGSLLLSDQIGDMVYELDSQGNLVGDFLDTSINNMRGIEYLEGRGILVVSSSTGLFTFDSTGAMLAPSVEGDYFDASGDLPGFLVTTEIDNDNLEAFRIQSGAKIGETQIGLADFPEQCGVIDTPNGKRVATNTFTPETVYVFNLDGTLDYSFVLQTSSGRGMIQLGNGNLLISTGSEIAEYEVDGTYVRQVIADSGGYRFFSRSANYQQ